MAQKQQVKVPAKRAPSNAVNRTIRVIIGAFLVLVITFSAVSICQNIGKVLKVDITDQKLYTLSDGTKAILAQLHQPIKARLYYAKTAALKGPDQIQFFNNYYQFVRALLEEYVAASKGMVELEVIDPRPFSDDEVQALRYGLRRFAITQEENFFFGLVLQTQFGVEKAIPFFSPERQNFVEYDISYLIDTAITRQKKRVGIMSSLPVMGDDVSGYMAEMMMRQGQQPKPAWTFVEQLRRKYEVKQVATDVNDIEDVDILLVVHPKDLPEKTLFAIDQFVLKGGRMVACVDPHCFADRAGQMPMQMRMQRSQSSQLNALLGTWGLEMPANTFAGDRSLAMEATITRDQRPERIIGYLSLAPQCFNTDNVITAELNQVNILFSGVLREVEDSNQVQSDAKIERVPLLMTTDRGNSWSIGSPFELMVLNAQSLMSKFDDGIKPVTMGYLITGRFKSSFPDGIEIEVELSEDESSDEPEDPNEDKKTKKLITGLKEAQQNCAVVVFADVDFISDGLAYQNSFFGKIVVGDNSALMMNTIDDLSGSSDLISIRSRGNFKRPFVVVDEIERQAEAETAEEVANINAQIAVFQSELQSILTSAKKGQEEVIGSSIVLKKKGLELKIHQAQGQLNEVKLKRRERIEHLGNTLRQVNMLVAPTVILIIAVALGLRRSVRKRHYISHASDA
ncbi:MAG: Gldg family protein [Planctomycetota bacterium]